MAAAASISISGDFFASLPLPLSSNSCIEPRASALRASTIFGWKLKTGKTEPNDLRLLTALRNNTNIALKASMGTPGYTQQLKNDELKTGGEAENGCHLFNDLKDRFLSFKRNKYMANIELFQNLAKGQAPKLMVIACADSRVCPSNILGFQPGEAFIVRNVANLVPPFERGPTETNAALEFAVNSLKIANIMVIGHSCCGGIRALMSLQDDENTSWVVVGKNARIKSGAVTSSLSFDQQCSHCEKESINQSLLNLLTYPWIEEKVAKGKLFIHGGYYNFIDCTFEKWTLDYRETTMEESDRLAVKDRMFWC